MPGTGEASFNREPLVKCPCRAVATLAHDMLRRRPAPALEETDDVMREALITLHRHLADAPPESERELPQAWPPSYPSGNDPKLRASFKGRHGMGTITQAGHKNQTLPIRRATPVTSRGTSASNGPASSSGRPIGHLQLLEVRIIWAERDRSEVEASPNIDVTERSWRATGSRSTCTARSPPM